MSNAGAFHDPVLAPIGSIDSFITFALSFSLLTHADEIDLLKRYKLHNDLKAGQKLVLHHLRLVTATAHSYSGYGLPQEDLIQEGSIGLMNAINKFDIGNCAAVRFCTFAIFQIKEKMLNYVINNWGAVKVITSKVHRKLFFNLRKLRDTIGHLTIGEMKRISDKLNVTIEDVRDMDRRLNSTSIEIDKQCEEGPSFELQSNSTVDSTLEKAEYEDLLTSKLTTSLEVLDERSRFIIESRHMTDNPLTLDVIGARFGISKERVRQLEKKAMEKIKEHLLQQKFNYIELQ